MNVFEAMLPAMESGATVGEVTGTIRMAYDQPFDPVGMVESPVVLRT
jgi:hypothetical protein